MNNKPIVRMNDVLYFVTTSSPNWPKEEYDEGHFCQITAAKLFAKHNSACSESWTCRVINAKTLNVLYTFVNGKEVLDEIG